MKVIVGAECPHSFTIYYSPRLSKRPPPTQISRGERELETELAVACRCFFHPESQSEFSNQWTAVCLSACLSVLLPFVHSPVRPILAWFFGVVVTLVCRTMNYSKGLLCTTQTYFICVFTVFSLMVSLAMMFCEHTHTLICQFFVYTARQSLTDNSIFKAYLAKTIQCYFHTARL